MSSERLSFPQHESKNPRHCTDNHPAWWSSTFRFTSQIENHSCRFSDERHVKPCNKYSTLILIKRLLLQKAPWASKRSQLYCCGWVLLPIKWLLCDFFFSFFFKEVTVQFQRWRWMCRDLNLNLLNSVCFFFLKGKYYPPHTFIFVQHLTVLITQFSPRASCQWYILIYIYIVTAEWGWILALRLFVFKWNKVFFYPEGKECVQETPAVYTHLIACECKDITVECQYFNLVTSLQIKCRALLQTEQKTYLHAAALLTAYCSFFHIFFFSSEIETHAAVSFGFSGLDKELKVSFYSADQTLTCDLNLTKTVAVPLWEKWMTIDFFFVVVLLQWPKFQYWDKCITK